MKKSFFSRAREFYAETYDTVVSDWPGELDFYRSFAIEAGEKDRSILELACGTGRVAIRLAKERIRVVGLDISAPMLDVAREKSQGISNIELVEGDMRSFNLGEKFGLILIPGHAFQNLVEVEDQVLCLQSIAEHLHEDGTLIIHLDHQNMSWLGGLVDEKGGIFEEAEAFIHPRTGHKIQTHRAWSYEPSTQTAIVQTLWEELDKEGNVSDRWESGLIRLHCVFRFEMEHLLALTGYEVEALYGNFFRELLTDQSEEMIWVARRAKGN
jgi:ubiquinone/menaquinone biosynthesis C-methylase UbiE